MYAVHAMYVVSWHRCVYWAGHTLIFLLFLDVFNRESILLAKLYVELDFLLNMYDTLSRLIIVRAVSSVVTVWRPTRAISIIDLDLYAARAFARAK